MRLKKYLQLQDILKSFPDLIEDHLGPLELEIEALCPIEYPDKNGLAYALSEKKLQVALKTNPSALIIPPLLKTSAGAYKGSVLISPAPELLAREISQKYGPFPTPYFEPWEDVSETSNLNPLGRISPRAFIHSSAKIDPEATVGPMAYVGSSAIIEKGVVIGAQAHIQSYCHIGESSVVHPFAFVGHHTLIGKRCELSPHSTVGKEGFGYSQDKDFNHFRIPHCGNVVLGNDVHIGSQTCIDRGTFQNTTIGSGTKIDNLVHIAHNSTIGEKCLITANVTMAGSTKLGHRMMIGGSTTISGHLEIGDDVHLAGCTGVTKSIHKPGVYGGLPAQPMGLFLKNQASIPKLQETRKSLQKLWKLFLKKHPNEKE